MESPNVIQFTNSELTNENSDYIEKSDQILLELIRMKKTAKKELMRENEALKKEFRRLKKSVAQ